MSSSTGGPQVEGTTRKVSDSSCAQAYANSLKCLDKNKGDKRKCAAEFAAYKQCKKDQYEQDRAERIATKKNFFW